MKWSRSIDWDAKIELPKYKVWSFDLYKSDPVIKKGFVDKLNFTVIFRELL